MAAVRPQGEPLLVIAQLSNHFPPFSRLQADSECRFRRLWAAQCQVPFALAFLVAAYHEPAGAPRIDLIVEKFERPLADQSNAENAQNGFNNPLQAHNRYLPFRLQGFVMGSLRLAMACHRAPNRRTGLPNRREGPARVPQTFVRCHQD